MGMGQNPIPLVNPKIAGKCHPPKYSKIGFDTSLNFQILVVAKNVQWIRNATRLLVILEVEMLSAVLNWPSLGPHHSRMASAAATKLGEHAHATTATAATFFVVARSLVACYWRIKKCSLLKCGVVEHRCPTTNGTAMVGNIKSTRNVGSNRGSCEDGNNTKLKQHGLFNLALSHCVCLIRYIKRALENAGGSCRCHQELRASCSFYSARQIWAVNKKSQDALEFKGQLWLDSCICLQWPEPVRDRSTTDRPTRSGHVENAMVAMHLGSSGAGHDMFFFMEYYCT